MAPRAEQITGLVLAGGRGDRLGGIDKGWVPYRGASASLQRDFASVGRAMLAWLESLSAVDVDEVAAFRNINSAEDAEGRAA